MTKMTEVRAFWDERAKLGFKAGSNDTALKKLEIAKIKEYVSDGMKILEIGCGNGVTAIELALEKDVDIMAFDYSDEMVKYANKNLEGVSLKGTVSFGVKSVYDIADIGEKFDLIISERVLINLNSWEEQVKAIEDIVGLLKEDGKYLMCENSADALDRLNVFREAIQLPAISSPWHNLYFRENDLNNHEFKNAILQLIESFTSTYYFLSRVINAWQAEQDNVEPSYDAPINQLANLLPVIGDIGQTKLWVWKQKGTN